MFQTRNDEPKYALLNDPVSQQKNRYGLAIQTVDQNNPLYVKSLQINDDVAVGDNPNRYKQHGFHFTADNCIGCHACEAACSEKNDLPAHIAFRSVGYVEGGTYPAFKRLNISMACNHCDDPVCLKGCPTNAYTKFAEYGAVLQDPDICFGCGYCTWVCPYNAPQLDPVKGEVSKCNMCVDRLEVGLKPACVAACLGNALDFGVIENTPEHRQQIKTEIPGLPRTDITHPNIRFEQTATLPVDMTRTDSMAVKYHRDSKDGSYKPTVDKNKFKPDAQWSFEKLRSREDPLVIFTLVTQAVIGAFMLLVLGSALDVVSIQSITQSVMYSPLLLLLLGMESLALFLSTMHLGKPHRFYRAFNNLRYSPVSREVAGVAVFFNCLLGHLFFGLFDYAPAQTLSNLLAYVGVVAGPVAIYFMHKIYRIAARPYWNHWQVLTAFYGNMLSLGAALVAMVAVPFTLYQGGEWLSLLQIIAPIMLLGLVLEAIGHVGHARDLQRDGREGLVSWYEQITTFGKTYRARNLILAGSIVLVALLLLLQNDSMLTLSMWALLGLMVFSASVISRALFYVLVIPTTMPGAFFWKNKGFEEHARATGLANMPQVGVVPDRH